VKRGKSVSTSGYNAARLLKAAGHPARLQILTALLNSPLCVSGIQETIEISQPNLSQHLALLKRAGLIVSQASGPMRCYYVLRPALGKSLLALVEKEHEPVVRTRESGIEEALKNRPAARSAEKRVGERSKGEAASRKVGKK